jgi:hypothetical protein
VTPEEDEDLARPIAMFLWILLLVFIFKAFEGAVR